MRVFVFVNRVNELGAKQTTSLLVAALLHNGHEIWLTDVHGFNVSGIDAVTELQLTTAAVQIPPERAFDSFSVARFSASIQKDSTEAVSIQENDVVLIRTNPGRDSENAARHELFLEFAQVTKSIGVRVINDPLHLAFFASKTAVALLPQRYRPQMIVTNDLNQAAEFVRDLNRECIIKPTHGSRGQNVIRTGDLSGDLVAQLNARFSHQSVIVQQFIESKALGDKRVVVFDGKPVEHQGHYAGIQRVPAEGDFRANLHAGGKAIPLDLTSDQYDAVTAAASLLHTNGIRLAGIDLVGETIIEFNVFSTGGLYDANRFANYDFAKSIATAIL